MITAQTLEIIAIAVIIVIIAVTIIVALKLEKGGSK